jgi:hypothetical protein
MQSLRVVDRLFPLVISGEKKFTIRWREVTIRPGYMLYVCDGDPAKNALVWVTKCTQIRLSEAAAFVGKDTEWPPAVMLAGMREHYPEISLTDHVQIIEHLTPTETRKRSDLPA